MRKKMKCNKIIGFLFLMIVIANTAEAFPEKWRETSASFTIIRDNITKLDIDNTVIGALIKASGRSIQELVNADGVTLVSFKIKYSAPVQLPGEATAKTKPITQIGLYETLGAEVRDRIKDSTNTTVNIKIGYSELDPIAIQFIFDEELYPAPTLLTDTIDAGWKPKNR